MSGRVSDYEYALPPERIARYPSARRDESRLLVLPPSGRIEHRSFRDVAELLEPGDLIVVNESKVLPARLLGRKPTGAHAEVLLLRPHEASEDGREWTALVRPGGKLKPGRTVVVAEDFTVEIIDSTGDGGRLVRLCGEGSVDELLQRHGHVPLPPYLGREDEPVDRDRYQTVYARHPGSVAAPTAGLHFTPELLGDLSARGVRRAAVTLHVGIGTFRPMEVDEPSEHRMHAEWYEIPENTARAVEQTRASGGRVWAVGTTSVRALESAADAGGSVRSGVGSTELFIHPPYEFEVVDALLTNFHLPRSTLLMLVAALGGYERTMDAYREAIRQGYRFYSYGDAMAVLPSSTS